MLTPINNRSGNQGWQGTKVASTIDPFRRNQGLQGTEP